MRFDRLIRFVKLSHGPIDEDGNRPIQSTVVTSRYADITDASTQTYRLMESMGKPISAGSLVIRIQGAVLEDFDRIEADGVYYAVQNRRKLRHLTTFVVSEDSTCR